MIDQITRCAVLAAAVCTMSATGATFSGSVIEDHTGAPAASVALDLYGASGEVIAQFETDGSGRFGGVELPPGEYQLEAFKPNFVSVRRPVRVEAATNLNIRMVRLGVITGAVHDSRGKPVPSAKVVAVPRPANGAPLRPTQNSQRAATTDEQGNYRIHGLAPGDYAVMLTWGSARRVAANTLAAPMPAAYGSGFAYYPSNDRPDFVTIESGSEARGIDFQLDPQPLYTLKAVVNPPEALTRFGIELTPASQPSFNIGQFGVVPGRPFTFDGLPAGSYRLSASRLGIQPNSIMQPDGRVTRLPPDTPALVIEPMFAQAIIQITSQGAPSTVELNPVPGRSVPFTLNAAPGCPAEAQLSLSPKDRWGPQGTTTAKLKAGEPVTVDGLAPGPYSISVDASAEGSECYAPTETTLDLTGGAPETPVAISIAPGASIQGTVDSGEADASGFLVRLNPADGSAAETVAPDAEAKFAFRNLRPGAYQLSIHGMNQSALTAPIAIDAQPGAAIQVDLVAPVQN